MTQVPAVPQQSAVPATQGDMQFATTGLEDFGMSDAVLPRIKIVQDKAYWIDNLTQTPMSVLRFIIVGLVKQRSLFHPNVSGDGDSPMCKSTDFETGYVNLEPPSKEKAFPWDLSGFNPADFPPDADGAVKLPCSGCALKDWGSHPTSNTPYCSEQFTLPIYYDTSGTPDGQDWSPAILTLQKSSLKPIRSYLTSFANSGRPAFIAICHGSLSLQHRGQVDYSIPTFIKVGESPRERWQEFAEQFSEMKEYLTRPPVREEDEATAAAPADNSWGNQPPAQQPVVQQPPAAPVPAAPPAQDPWTQQQQPAAAPAADPWAAPAPAPVAGDPWAVPAAQAQPAPVAEQQPAVAQAPPPPPPVQQAPPVAPPPPPPAQQAPAPPAAPPVAPPAPPVQQAPPPAQPVAEQPVAPANPGQELPF